MEIIASIWNKDGNYSETNRIKRFRRNMYILPESWNTDVKNKVGSTYLLAHKNQLGNEDCNNTCCKLKKMRLKSNARKTDTKKLCMHCRDTFPGTRIPMTSMIRSGRRWCVIGLTLRTIWCDQQGDWQSYGRNGGILQGPKYEQWQW